MDQNKGQQPEENKDQDSDTPPVYHDITEGERNQPDQGSEDSDKGGK